MPTATRLLMPHPLALASAATIVIAGINRMLPLPQDRRRQIGLPERVLDGAVSQAKLVRAGVVAVVGEG